MRQKCREGDLRKRNRKPQPSAFGVAARECSVPPSGFPSGQPSLCRKRGPTATVGRSTAKVVTTREPALARLLFLQAGRLRNQSTHKYLLMVPSILGQTILDVASVWLRPQRCLSGMLLMFTAPAGRHDIRCRIGPTVTPCLQMLRRALQRLCDPQWNSKATGE